MLDLKVELVDKAFKATQAYLDTHFGGHDNYPCGFAWVAAKPLNHGNSREGREERAKLRALGFEASYENPKIFHLWNPGKHRCQNVDAKYAGAIAACEVLAAAGIIAYPCQRWD